MKEPEAKKLMDGDGWQVGADVSQTERAQNETAVMREESVIVSYIGRH
jgi:hypothetical protein